MNKLLYIGDSPTQITNGGDWINKRNILALQQIYGSQVSIFPIKCNNKFWTFLNLLQKYMLGLSSSNVRQILSLIKKNNIDSVFLASSKYGKLASRVKRTFPHVKICAFFHNIEYQYTLEECRVCPTWKNRLIAKVTASNEQDTCLYADKLIVLNNRDASLLDKIYGKKADIILPTTFIDKYSKSRTNQTKIAHNVCTLLFVGSAFFANIEGVSWFIDNVLPALKGCMLQIVGNGMEEIFKSSYNIGVHGFVKDLADFYYRADIVVLPIFSGGGMKTKTAEALMYGCPIVGTREAFEGYELDYDKIGGMANSKEEMIRCINELCTNEYLLSSAKSYARTIFLEKYDFKKTINILQNQL